MGYAAADQTDLTQQVNQTIADWEGTFALGTFKTTATPSTSDTTGVSPASPTATWWRAS